MLSLYPIYRLKNQGLEKLYKLPTVTQLGSRQTELKIQTALCISCSFLLSCFLKVSCELLTPNSSYFLSNKRGRREKVSSHRNSYFLKSSLPPFLPGTSRDLTADLSWAISIHHHPWSLSGLSISPNFHSSMIHLLYLTFWALLELKRPWG